MEIEELRHSTVHGFLQHLRILQSQRYKQILYHSHHATQNIMYKLRGTGGDGGDGTDKGKLQDHFNTRALTLVQLNGIRPLIIQQP